MTGFEKEKPPKLVQAFNTYSKHLMFIASSIKGNEIHAE